VGFGGFANFMGSAFIMGISAGVQAIAARRKGAGREDEMALPLNGGLLLAVVLGLPLSVLLIYFAPVYFPVLSTDPLVVGHGVPYLQARMVALVAIGMNYSFRGYWNGVNLSRLYMRTLLVMHVSNILLNSLLIFGLMGFPEMGATGAGVGTALSTFIGTAYYFFLANGHARSAGFLRRWPSPEMLKTLLRLSVPEGMRSLLFAGGLTALFAIIDRIGTAEVAAANVLVNIQLVAYLPAMGLGLAAASLVGQALGKDDVEDAERWGWEVVRIAVLGLAVLGLPMVLVPEWILGAFFHDDPVPLALGVNPLRMAGAFMCFEGVGMVLLVACMGAGATRLSMLLSTGLQWLLFLPTALLLGPVLGFGLFWVWTANIGYRVLQAIVFAFVWKSRRWSQVAL